MPYVTNFMLGSNKVDVRDAEAQESIENINETLTNLTEKTDTNTTDIGNINENISTINGNISTIDTSIDRIDNNINVLYTKTNSLTSPNNLFRGGQLLCFGDSWGVGTGSSSNRGWVNRLGPILGCTTLNYCVGGAAYSQTGSLRLSAQVDTAAAEIENKSNIRAIVIVAGVNDCTINSSLDAVTTAIQPGVQEMYGKIVSNFPGIPIYVAINCRGNSLDNVQNIYRCHMLASILRFWYLSGQPYVNVISNAHNTIAYMSDTFTSDYLHPNDAGYALFTGYLASAMINGDSHFVRWLGDLASYKESVVTTTSGVNSINVFKSDGDLIFTTGILTLSGAVITQNDYTRLFNLPDWLMTPQNYWTGNMGYVGVNPAFGILGFNNSNTGNRPKSLGIVPIRNDTSLVSGTGTIIFPQFRVSTFL